MGSEKQISKQTSFSFQKKFLKHITFKMAKSLRSKWKRKMKAEKRIKYGEREEKRLIKMLEAAKELKENDGDDKVMEPTVVESENNERRIWKLSQMDVKPKSGKDEKEKRKSILINL